MTSSRNYLDTSNGSIPSAREIDSICVHGWVNGAGLDARNCAAINQDFLR
jgi:hypothetical protein